jgi:hypothetical protein
MKLSKDQSILKLLRRLTLGSRGWTTIDYWEADLCAIGIASKQQPRRHQCEKPTGPRPEDYETIDRGENVEFTTLVEAIEKHLA